jgi:hypothetical protein
MDITCGVHGMKWPKQGGTVGLLSKKATCSKMEQVQTEGGRTVKRAVEIYNLDTIISVGYRISSKTGTKFRQWATKTLHDHIVLPKQSGTPNRDKGLARSNE